MILGVQIINFDIFDNDQAGILIDESISPAREGGQRANPMRKLNALIGRNNTGKTSFMGCLAYMKDCVTDGVTAASISCGRPGFSNMTPDKSKPSKFKVFFKLGDRETGKSDYIQYELSILANRFGTPVVSYEKAVRSTREEDGTYKMTTLLEVTDGEGFVLCPERDDGTTEEISLDDDHRTIIGVHMIGSYASEIIYGAAAYVAEKKRVEDVRKLVFPHPTVCEVIREGMFAI